MKTSLGSPYRTRRRAGGPLKLGAAVAAVAAVVAATGCSPAGDDEPIVITFWKYQDPVQQPVLEALIEEYNSEQDDVVVELQTFPFDQYLAEKVITAMSAGTGPDVFWVSAATVLNFAPEGLLLPLQDTFTDELQADFLPQSLESITFGEDIYGIPHEMGIQGLLYNETLLADAGLEVPTTWDELATSASELSGDGRSGLLLPTNPDVFQNFIWWPFLWSNGGSVVNDDWSEATINEPEAVGALQYWKDLADSGAIAPTSSGAFGDELGQGTVAMAALGMWAVSNLTTNYPDVTVGAAPLPIPEGGTPSAAFGGWYTAVSAASEHPEEAKDFAVWLFGEDPENALELTTAMTTLSPRISVTNDLMTDPTFTTEPLAGFLPAWETARPEPAYPAEINTAVTDALQAVMFGGKEAQDAADEAAAAIDTYLATEDAQEIRDLLDS